MKGIMPVLLTQLMPAVHVHPASYWSTCLIGPEGVEQSKHLENGIDRNLYFDISMVYDVSENGLAACVLPIMYSG